jgi:hypothetical protein
VGTKPLKIATKFVKKPLEMNAAMPENSNFWSKCYALGINDIEVKSNA